MELGFFIPKIIHIKSSISILIMMKTSNTCKKKCGSLFLNWRAVESLITGPCVYLAIASVCFPVMASCTTEMGTRSIPCC